MTVTTSSLPGDAEPRTTAFIYDRQAVLNEEAICARRAACHRYATLYGYTIAGWWLDVGPVARELRRPEFAAMLSAVRAVDGPRVVLVRTWGRLSFTPTHRRLLVGLIHHAGAWAETADGERRVPASPLPPLPDVRIR